MALSYPSLTRRRFSFHSIVGKGNHSVNHVQKLKPRVEQLCRDLGLQYATEENAGRIYVNLTGGPADIPPKQEHHQHHGGEYDHTAQHHHNQKPQPAREPPAQAQQKDEAEQVVDEALPGLLGKLAKACCIVM